MVSGRTLHRRKAARAAAAVKSALIRKADPQLAAAARTAFGAQWRESELCDVTFLRLAQPAAALTTAHIFGMAAEAAPNEALVSAACREAQCRKALCMWVRDARAAADAARMKRKIDAAADGTVSRHMHEHQLTSAFRQLIARVNHVTRDH